VDVSKLGFVTDGPTPEVTGTAGNAGGVPDPTFTNDTSSNHTVPEF
jgi:hypothetical protein